MINFYKVSKKFGKSEIIKDISFEISDSEFVFLIGPTGSGKTTIIRLLIKDLLPSVGDINVDKWQLSKISSRNIHLFRRNIGVIFQDLKLLSDKTLFENVALALEILKKNPQEIKNKVKEILKFVNLQDKLNYFPQELSGGELQRAAIARAVITDPTYILADEPTADLDPSTSWQIIQLFAKLNKMGKTVLFSTHNFDIVNSLKKRVITLKNGAIVKDEKIGRYK